MSHPIDDLFKKGLTNLPQEGHEEGWAKARVLLGFEKRRKKRFFLFFFLGGLVFMAAAITAGMSYWNGNDGMEILASDNSKTGDNPVLSSQSKTSVSDDKNLLAKPLDTEKVAAHEEVDVSERISSRIQKEEINNQGFQKEDTRKQNKQSIDLESTTSLKSKSIDRKVGELERELGGRRNVTLTNLTEVKDEFKNEKDQSSLPSVANGVKKSEALTERSIDGVLEDGLDSESGLPRHLNIGISKLDKLDIGYLDFSRATLVVPELERIVVVEDSKIAFEKSIYVDYHNRFNRIGLGVSGRLKWDDKWSSELSFGVNRSTNDASDNFETNTVFDPDNLANVSSVNEYEFYSLNATLRVSRHIERSRFFVGFEAERPILLNGLQEVEVSPQRTMDMALFDVPMGTASAPITSVIDYNLMTVPELNRFVYYGQLGYGYRISALLDLSFTSSFQFSKTIDASPLLPQGDIITRQKKWGLGIRVDLRF